MSSVGRYESGNALAIRNLSRDYDVADGRKLAVLQGVDLDVAARQANWVRRLVGPVWVGEIVLAACGRPARSRPGRCARHRRPGLCQGRRQAAHARAPVADRFRLSIPSPAAGIHRARQCRPLPQRILGRKPAEAEARARELLEVMGLKERMDHLPAQLSGGEQQRDASPWRRAPRPMAHSCCWPTNRRAISIPPPRNRCSTRSRPWSKPAASVH